MLSPFFSETLKAVEGPASKACKPTTNAMTVRTTAVMNELNGQVMLPFAPRSQQAINNREALKLWKDKTE